MTAPVNKRQEQHLRLIAVYAHEAEEHKQREGELAKHREEMAAKYGSG